MRQEVIDTKRAWAVADRPLELAVIIPTFNESANVQQLLERLSIGLADISWEAVLSTTTRPMALRTPSAGSRLKTGMSVLFSALADAALQLQSLKECSPAPRRCSLSSTAICSMTKRFCRNCSSRFVPALPTSLSVHVRRMGVAQATGIQGG